MKRDEEVAGWSRWWPLAILVTGGVLTIAAWSELRTTSRRELAREIEAQSVAVRHEIGARLEDRVRALERMAGRWERGGHPARELWQAEAVDHIAHAPGYRALGVVDASRHVTWLVPLGENAAALGADLATDPVAGAAMDEAEHGRVVRATPPLPLVQGGSGVLVLCPMFLGAGRFDGFLVAELDAGRLLSAIVEPDFASELAIRVAVDGRTIFERGPATTPADAAWSRTGMVRVAGLAWDVGVGLSARGRAARLARYPEGVALAGAWVSILLTVAVSAAQRASGRKRALERVHRELLEAMDDRLQAEGERRDADTLLRGERTLFVMMANRAPLASSLVACCRLVESVCPRTRAAILLRDPQAEVLRPGVAPSLPPAYLAALDGLTVGPTSGCCGTCAFRKAPVVVADIANDPLWEGFRDLAAGHGLRACWSYPIFDQAGAVAGTFAVYRSEVGAPSEAEVAVIERVRDLAAIAMELSGAERALRLTQFAVDHVADQIFLIDPNGRFRDVNEAACRRLGYTRDELLTMAVGDIDPDLPHDAWPQSWAEVQRLRQWRFETRHRSQSGEIYPVELTANYVDHEGEQYSYAVVRDITAWRRNLAALAESEGRLRLATEAGRMGIWEWDASTRELRHSPNLRVLFGLPPAETSEGGAQTFTRAVHPDDVAHVRAAMAVAVAGTAVEALEFRIRWPDGALHWIAADSRVHRDAEGKAVRLVGIVTDIDQRKRAEHDREDLLAEVRAANDRLTQLSRQLMDVQENERRDLSRDLHDEIGQCIAAVKINLDLLCRRFPIIEPEAPVADTRALLDHLLQHVSRLCVELRPSLLDDLGLSAALRWYLHRQAERTGWRVEYLSDDLPKLAEKSQDACFRIVQEAVTDAMRHAEARHVVVELRRVGALLRLRVQDDGIGFDSRTPITRPWASGGLGLLGMRERARAIGGDLVIEPRPGGGTIVEARIPLGDEREAPAVRLAHGG